jgi:hypothetical protein
VSPYHTPPDLDPGVVVRLAFLLLGLLAISTPLWGER